METPMAIRSELDKLYSEWNRVTAEQQIDWEMHGHRADYDGSHFDAELDEIERRIDELTEEEDEEEA